MPKRLSLVPVALLLACFTEGGGGPGSGNDSDPDGSDESSAGESDSSATNGMSSTSVGTSGTSTSTDGTTSMTTMTSTSMTTSDETDSGPPPVCGHLGESCCDAACEEGACLAGTCVAFAGAYLDGEMCPDCPRVLDGPSCGCPEGFATSAPFPVLSSGCIKDGPLMNEPWIDELVSFCAAPYVPGADWGGAYLEDLSGQMCGGSDCVVGNPDAADACACPDGTNAVLIDLFGFCGAEAADPPPYRLGLCLGSPDDALTLGGVVYGQGPDCIVEHPATGTCDCPPGWQTHSFRVISQAQPNAAGDLGFCVRAP
ncbi:MAG TPA: hypothetical protein VG755_15020 [Nannocystaceae bacterium]|nr:hypothetical protein [Nannocystaceae bacterium]